MLTLVFLWIAYPKNKYKWLYFVVLGFDENLDVQGELILQDSFQVWDPKSLIRKGRERHLFLFEISLVFSKEIKDSSGHTKYVYKNKLLVGVAAKKIFWVLFFVGRSDVLEAHMSPAGLGLLLPLEGLALSPAGLTWKSACSESGEV